ncbi:MAG: phospholipase C, phosphocholine-specific [Williamsia sp.]|nr:phospholipase C, phosphocholine-specific [Williamsia sp.]
MDSRREFIKKAALLAGSTGLHFSLPASIQKALSIDPTPGSSYLDAEHIVFLMQENRSFDHCYGTLQGVRGFNDPRAITLPNNNPVWLQTDATGKTYAPFPLDIKNTRATWIGSLPHSWTNQVDARNEGRYDRWLDVKKSGHPAYSAMPLTMGYYTRQDLPFYYALADAFTICDQHFCSSLTGTTPNRLYFWSGTIRAEQREDSKANVWNEDADYDTMVNWKTYPERLEENGVSWKVYQNDLSVPGGYTDEQDAWMANFGDNPLEYFTQYHVKLSPRYIRYLQGQLASLPAQIRELEEKIREAATQKEAGELGKKLADKKKALQRISEESLIYTTEKYNALSPHEKSLHEKAFCNNQQDPLFYKLTTLHYREGGEERTVTVPAGDVLHQFREDVSKGRLPTVSWLVAPENFSDHPSSAWYGAWYISEVLDILTKNPDVWKKTIFVLTYDENDGYFDHVPPFVAPDPRRPETGKTSPGIDARVEYVTMEQEEHKAGSAPQHRRQSPIGLGYRVPLVIASPWSRGGWVNSQVFDHTSSLQFLEKFLEKKTGKKIIESSISSWRRAVCGDLSSVFRPYDDTPIDKPVQVMRDAFLESIHQAKFKALPAAYRELTPTDLAQISTQPLLSPLMPRQEKGTRPSCALPYELYADMLVDADRAGIEIIMKTSNQQFGKSAAGSAFAIYAPGMHKGEKGRSWQYATAAGEHVRDKWRVSDFEKGNYHLRVYGPNGFFREFRGSQHHPAIQVTCTYDGEKALVKIDQPGSQRIEVVDNIYKAGKPEKLHEAAGKTTLQIGTDKSGGWYDFSIKISGVDLFERRYAGRVETGKPATSDPAMGMAETGLSV